MSYNISMGLQPWHDTKNKIGPTKPLSYENITKLELVVWREYSEIIGFEYCGSVSMSKVT